MPKRARNKWGGARAGAGRPPSGARSSEPHKTRPSIGAHHAVHIRARMVAAIGRGVRDAIARAIDLSIAREDFRIIHIAARARQLELIVEATDKVALARGMQGFQVSAARSLNRAAGRTGQVFADRYRTRVLATRQALASAIARLPRKARPRIGAPESPLFTPARASASLADRG